jgi:lipid A disaccharide synthetase
MVILYRVNPLLYFLGSGVMDARFAGLVNNLAGHMICPERIMWRPEPDWVAEKALGLLQNADRRKRCADDIADVMRGFARPGASARAAAEAARVMRNRC